MDVSGTMSSKRAWSRRLCNEKALPRVAKVLLLSARERPPATGKDSPRMTTSSSGSSSVSSRMMCITRRTMLPMTSST